MDNTEIQFILNSIGVRVPPSSKLILIGGSALALLGSPRQTIDIDFVGDDVHPNELHKTILQAAKELKINVEPFPLTVSSLCQRAAQSARFISDNSEIWIFMLPILTASP